MGRVFYTLGWYAATPLVALYLLWRSRRQPEYRQHWAERWGRFSVRRDDDREPLIWIHAVSVGETRAAQPLLAALSASHPRAKLLLTCMTPTGRATAATLFADLLASGRLVQAYLPYDYPHAVRAFLRAWRPAVGILLETELWPNLVAGARVKGVPLALVNARLSASSLRKGLRWPSLIRPALQGLSLVAARTGGDAERIAALGRAAEVVTGNMKFDVPPPPALVEQGRQWRRSLGGRPVVLAASTREGEEALLLAAWARSRAAAPARPLLVIVPRHPQRFDDVAEAIVATGLTVQRRSAWGEGSAAAPGAGVAAEPDDRGRRDADTGTAGQRSAGAVAGQGEGEGADVLLGDSMGEMFAWYGMADVAIIGGSLLPFGAQNLIEACAVGVPVLLGPSTYNFAEAAEQAIGAGAALRVTDAAAALTGAVELLADDDRRRRMSEAAHAFAAAHRGATQRTMDALGPLLARLD